MSGATCCSATATSALDSDYRATNLAAYGELEWRLAPPRCCPSDARGENRSADYHDSDGAAFSPDETMFGGSLNLRHDFGDARTAT